MFVRRSFFTLNVVSQRYISRVRIVTGDYFFCYHICIKLHKLLVIIMDNYIKIIKGLSEKNRVRILALLHRIKTEVCVCEIVDALEECQYNVSRHLKVFQQAGRIVIRKKGK